MIRSRTIIPKLTQYCSHQSGSAERHRQAQNDPIMKTRFGNELAHKDDFFRLDSGTSLKSVVEFGALLASVYDKDEDMDNEAYVYRACFLSSFCIHENHLKHIRRHFYLRVSRLYEVEDRSPGLFRQCASPFGAISERSIERIHLLKFSSFVLTALCKTKNSCSLLLPRRASSCRYRWTLFAIRSASSLLNVEPLSPTSHKKYKLAPTRIELGTFRFPPKGSVLLDECSNQLS